ncbi:Beta-glucanase [Dactylellina cionopaga]|nr:Beta-glucanase [Dactylellina cionopaga]
MQVKRFIIVAAGLLPAALAQTSSLCNPLKGCFKDDPALGTTWSYDFTQNHSPAPKFDIVSSASRISYEGDGMHMRVQMKGDSPTMQSQFYIFWGKVEIVMKAGPGAGIVSSLVLQSDDLDEIDVEFIGSQPGNVQTNIFSKGNQDVHIYGANTGVADAVGVFHKYTVDWTPEAITWSIDGNVVRTLTHAALGDVYPQTPMQIKFGPWAAGDPSNAPGTIQWAGGEIQYDQGPFDMVVASLTVTDYSTGATKYRYKDTSGSSSSIEITGGGAVNPPAPDPKPTTSAPPPPPPPTTTSKPPPPPPTTTSTPPPPPPPPTTTSSKSTPPPPPPPPTTTSTTSTTFTTSTTSELETTTSPEPTSTKPTTTSKEPEPTSSIELETKLATTSSEATSTSSKPKPTSTSEEEKETTTQHVSKSTFVVESKTVSAPTTFETNIATPPVNNRVTANTNTPTPNSGNSIRAASPLILALAALFVLF